MIKVFDIILPKSSLLISSVKPWALPFVALISYECDVLLLYPAHLYPCFFFPILSGPHISFLHFKAEILTGSQPQYNSRGVLLSCLFFPLNLMLSITHALYTAFSTPNHLLSMWDLIVSSQMVLEVLQSPLCNDKS